jgi:hypothetical protein
MVGVAKGTTVTKKAIVKKAPTPKQKKRKG